MGPRAQMKQYGYEDLEAGDGQDVPLGELGVLIKPYFWPKDSWSLRIRAIVSVSLVGASRAFRVLAPLYLKEATNELIATAGVPTTAIATYVGFLFLSNSSKQLQTFLYLRVMQNAYKEVSAAVFTHLHVMSMHFHLTKKTGKVMRVLDRGIDSTDSIVNVLFFRLVPTILEVVAVSLIFLFAFREELLTIVCGISVVVYVIATVLGTKVRLRFKKASNKHDNDANEKAVDSLTNFETVKYFCSEQYEVDRYLTSIDHFQSSAFMTRGLTNTINVTQQFIQGVCLLLCLLIAGAKVKAGSLTVGDFVAVGSYITQIFKPLDSLGAIYNTIMQSIVDMSNLVEILLVEPDIQDAPGATALVLAPQQSAIAFEHVGFSYPGQPFANSLKDVSFTISPGQTLAVVGSTGAGKSTLSRLLFRFYDVTAGRICIDGQDIAKVTQASLRQAIGIVPQDAVMFNDTILYNIQYGRHTATEAEVVDAAKAARLYDFVMTLPLGFQTRVGERGLKLSGGEKQRVAIARAILKNPRLMVLDEATSALDTRTERSIYESLVEVCANRTTMIIAHRLSTIQHAHQILVLERGEIVEFGSHDALLEKQGAYHLMWSQQSAIDVADSDTL
ncbi:ATP-binding Cassette (ABC) Superfamily [Achlya hypogyna]|uniref:ATP-binding Cassette (ABC) Superfamily n=1 Tax=Achlya hypogyna TaxID=1202772 RepID=A0A1V9YFA6_ACHHY|nr:ATP-binding Cassette (ABC) Superfamily [Achlya hypogyna]